MARKIRATIPGLASGVRVWSEAYAAPQIFARDMDSAARTPGYLLFQMEGRRRVGEGRLAEMPGGDLTSGWSLTSDIVAVAISGPKSSGLADPARSRFITATGQSGLSPSDTAVARRAFDHTCGERGRIEDGRGEADCLRAGLRENRRQGRNRGGGRLDAALRRLTKTQPDTQATGGLATRRGIGI